MTSEHYFKARAAVGRAAISIANDHSQEVASDTLSGVGHAALLAVAEMVGWDRVLHDFQQLAQASRVPATFEKPKLKIVNGG